MTTTAQSVIQEVQQDFLTDLTGDRFPASLLVRALNNMQRAISVARPDSTATNRTATLAAGVEQVLAATDQALIEWTNNVAGSKTAVRQCQREDLDAIEPTWRNATQSATIVHFMYDPRHPRRFDVYPPAIVGTQIAGIVSAYPTDVAAPSGDGKSYTTVSGNISLADEFAPALKHLTAYAAYAKDAEYAANAALAAQHLELAVGMVGEQLRALVGITPGSQKDATT